MGSQLEETTIWEISVLKSKPEWAKAKQKLRISDFDRNGVYQQ